MKGCESHFVIHFVFSAAVLPDLMELAPCGTKAASPCVCLGSKGKEHLMCNAVDTNQTNCLIHHQQFSQMEVAYLPEHMRVVRQHALSAEYLLVPPLPIHYNFMCQQF